MNLLALMAVLPLTSARSSLVLSLSIFSFQSFDRSFSMQEDSVGGEEEKGRGVICASLYCNEENIPPKNDPMVGQIRTEQTFHATPQEHETKREKENR